MIKKIICLAMACGLALSAFAQDNTPVNNSLFNREISVFVGSSYQLDGGNYQPNLTIGGNAFINKFLGLNVSLPVYNDSGLKVESVNFGPVVRVPVFKYFAPYVGANATYNWKEDVFSYYGRAGLEVRLNKHWGVFGESNYRIDKLNWTSTKNGNWAIQGGLNLVF